MKCSWKTKALNEILQYRVVSFDVFDTLINRCCHRSSDVFDAVEELYNETEEVPLNGFAKMRFEAELQLYRGGKKIPSLEDIYRAMHLSTRQQSKLMDLEIELEKKLAIANSDVYELYTAARANGAAVIAISDMYLPSSIIAEILENCGYSVDLVFVSCEHNACKSDGSLFGVALDYLSLPSERLIHIGDNVRADIKGARLAGIDAIAVPGKIWSLGYTPRRLEASEGGRFLLAHMNRHVLLSDDCLERAGYETLGPVIYGFCQWVKAIQSKYGYEKLLFCARDAQQTMDIYRMLFPEDADKVSYLCVSLKSLKRPYLTAMGKSSAPEDLEQLSNLRSYLRQSGCKGNVAMVDSGFGGHTQHMLQTILGESCKLHGIYMRMSRDFPNNVDDPQASCYLFRKRPTAKARISGAFFESLIQATHGRTEGYALDADDRTVVPVFGEACPDAKEADRIHSGINRFCEEWKESPFGQTQIDATVIENAFLELTFFPHDDVLEELKDMKSGNEDLSPIVIQRPKNAYFKHPSLFFGDLRQTFWKGGFLKYVFGRSLLVGKAYLLLDCIAINLRRY